MTTTSYRTIGLTAKLHMEDKDRVLAPVVDALRTLGVEILVDPHTTADVACTKGFAPIDKIAALDLLVAVGGDGTILRSIRELRPGNVPVVAVNAGSVGFLSEMPLADVGTRLPLLLQGGGHLERRACIDIEVDRAGEPIFTCTALNDAVISQGCISRLLNLKASIGGQFLATYHADGLIVATPTGSTAYSLAAGGPVVHPTLAALILTPINPHSFTQKPIVVPGDDPIDVLIARSETTAYANCTVGLTVDGQVYHELQPGDRIRARTGASVVFLRGTTDAFYRSLRHKLRWADGLEE